MANFYSAAKKIRKTGKQQQVVIESLDQSLCGVTHIDNKVVFVPGALPQERVAIQVVNEQKKYSKASLIEVIEASEQRISPCCPHYDECGGCQTQHLAVQQQLAAKIEGLEKRFAKVAKSEHWQDAVTSAPWHYRRRGRISVHVEKNKQLRVGFRQQGSSDIVNIERCDVFAKPFDKIFSPLYDLIDKLDGRESIGHVEVIATAQHNVALFRVTSKLCTSDIDALTAFAETQQLTVLLESNNAQIHPLPGFTLPNLTYALDKHALGFTPGNFIQVNDEVNQQMVSKAVQWLDVKDTDTVLDLFCGVGNFSLALAEKAQTVIGVEGVKEMAEQASANASKAKINNAQFYHCNLAQPLIEQQWFGTKLRKKVDKILLDPARDGALDICRQLSQLQPSKIVYVACDAASLERDSKEIIAQGYQVAKICALDMFPQTSHVESMALFVKSKTKPKRPKKGLLR
ncbi:23S rRNA (uracil(1939)-C(5))-methyltransferase RlmD [Psychrobium sp. MM17-31]|uniref:23S rRNA (uracil(1939)-C(5))-methyltransferase RlmD n=1 Tax=Psychrobium sp. MM17-31 TaxID=2917758 RepID=UPI001EF4F6A3|nr:23S rRNA (uracil(1939)-C(5))-methyltransferase RlmD [Psychrobium sp. MM17-31]MCG7529873.1 23S rRNA (uracil(1939)-C(5))-methyltransferase RlmD [Psychrobium sp. MM17-31]